MTLIQTALADCLEALARGQKELRACLDGYADLSEELEDYLEIAAALKAARVKQMPARRWQNKLLKKLLTAPPDPFR